MERGGGWCGICPTLGSISYRTEATEGGEGGSTECVCVWGGGGNKNIQKKRKQSISAYTRDKPKLCSQYNAGAYVASSLVHNNYDAELTYVASLVSVMHE